MSTTATPPAENRAEETKTAGSGDRRASPRIAIAPRRLSGTIDIQPSKSAGHRMLIAAALAQGISRIENPGASEDIAATIGALESLGLAAFEKQAHALLVTGSGGVRATQSDDPRTQNAATARIVDCGESGSTLRFLLPLALDGTQTLFTGHGRLLERPMGVYESLLKERGISWSHSAEGIAVCGRLPSGVYRLRGDVSSQFVTGLLFALPMAKGDSRIELTTPLQSRGYVELTMEAMAAFGVHVNWDGESAIAIPDSQQYSPANSRVEGDYSHAAFFLVAGAIGGGIDCCALRPDTRQGDRAIVEVLRSMGADVFEHNGAIAARPSRLHGTMIDASQIPDLVPILAVAACAAQGETRIANAARLRLKESDRLGAMARELNKLGGAVEELPDGLVIRGAGKLAGGAADSHNDHRVAMSLAIASAICESDVVLTGGESVKKSAPDFWCEFQALGGLTYGR